MQKKICHWSIKISIILIAYAFSATTRANEIDVLFTYDQASENATPLTTIEARVAQWENEINGYFDDSGVNLTMNVVGVKPFNPLGNESRSILEEISNSSTIASWRDDYGADFVAQISPVGIGNVFLSGNRGHYLHHKATWEVSAPGNIRTERLIHNGKVAAIKQFIYNNCYLSGQGSGYVVTGDCNNMSVRLPVCGIASPSGIASNAFSVNDAGCGSLTIAHELGHNMGLAHDRFEGSNQGTFYSYGRGHGINGLFHTIMAYGSSFNTSNRVGMYSTPLKPCNGNHSCGVAAGSSDEADAVRAINNRAAAVSSFRPTRNTSSGETIISRGTYGNYTKTGCYWVNSGGTTSSLTCGSTVVATRFSYYNICQISVTPTFVIQGGGSCTSYRIESQ